MLEIGKDMGAKVRRLIDGHAISLGVDPKIPPIALTEADFDAHVTRAPGAGAKASEMERAIRSHRRRRMDEDPVRDRRRSERLDAIPRSLDERREDLIAQRR